MDLLLLAALASASELDVGGAVDVAAQVVVEPSGLGVAAGLRQAEGDLRWRAGAVTTQVELDVIAVAGAGAPPVWVLLRPEVLTIAVDAGSASLAAGLAPAPFRVERVDGWDNAFVSWSGMEALLPGQLGGAALTLGGGRGELVIVGGLDLGTGLGVGAGLGGSGWGTAGPSGGASWVVGARGQLATEAYEVGGGVFAWPGGDWRGGGLEAGARVPIGRVAIQGEAVIGWDATSGGTLQVELFPAELVTPALRAQWIDGDPGGALVVAFHPAEWCVLKVEGAYAAGAPAAWFEAAVYSPWETDG